MWMIELAMNTMTAAVRIGNHNAVRETMPPSWLESEMTCNLGQRLSRYAETVKRRSPFCR
jgi:hypothetical protein